MGKKVLTGKMFFEIYNIKILQFLETITTHFLLYIIYPNVIQYKGAVFAFLNAISINDSKGINVQ